MSKTKWCAKLDYAKTIADPLRCRRPRDADARRGLIQLALKRRAQWLEDGRLEKIGPRHYRLHLD